MDEVDGISNMVSLFCGSMWGRAQKGDNAVAWSLEFCLGGSCAPALALMPDTSISPRMPPVPSSCCSSAEAHRDSVYVSPKSVVGLLRGDI